LDLDRPIMAASGNENIVDIDDTEQNNDVLSSDIVCIYPKNDKNPVTVRLSDYESLEYNTYLNDAIVNFAIVHIFANLDSQTREKIYIFDTHFYAKLSSLPVSDNLTEAERKHLKVCRWTKKTNLFDKEMIIIPVCEGQHWFLILVINPGVITVT